MKKTILSAIAAFALLSFTTSCDSDDREKTITPTDLPAPVDVFVTQHFPNATYARVTKEHKTERDGSLYDVLLTNGFEIEFDAAGNWVDIEGHYQPVPVELIPEKINAFVTENYKDSHVTSIDNEPGHTEIELSNRLELIFDPNGNFVGIDR
ncbi:PepSY-like domain-containing protein [Flavobacterium sp. DG2-3]|uniref:PepSY-like domain-containing protein n=1 Tax=Flavobacterium sp. DG2-3 TaxID=3068317 RepID=UPI00273E22EC|nr:PepSY-like domain-containing protein [Flavobacterium sp. DG2-3]MDP5199124.1 PepSY-like domain-containing protein [Flavobacterium sp. DG2-3]